MTAGEGVGHDTRLARNLAAEIECPFCGEGDFDLNGLKGHLQGGCEAYDAVASIHDMTAEELLAGSEASREFRATRPSDRPIRDGGERP